MRIDREKGCAMTRIATWIAFALVLLSGAAFAHAAGPVGLLSMVSGTVQIVRAGEKTPAVARTADLIQPGDRVVTGRNSEASFLFCPEKIGRASCRERGVCWGG